MDRTVVVNMRDVVPIACPCYIGDSQILCGAEHDDDVDCSQLLQRPVDLVPLDGASPDLCHHVLADRVLLFDGDHDARIEFEVRQLRASGA